MILILLIVQGTAPGMANNAQKPTSYSEFPSQSNKKLPYFPRLCLHLYLDLSLPIELCISREA